MSLTLSESEKERLKNVEENRIILETLISKVEMTPEIPDETCLAEDCQERKRRKLSHPLIERTVLTRSLYKSSEDSKSDYPSSVRAATPASTSKVKNLVENVFGEIPDYPVGSSFSTRMECCRAGVHRSPIAGIHGSIEHGCYSLSLSGGYEDDIDNGHSFTYTGSGGRDLTGTKSKPKNLRTAPQSADQTLTGMNLALSLNMSNGNPIRVIRGFKLSSPFAPEEGYRYDGLYKVENYYQQEGKSGFKVLKYKLVRLESQDPPPWEMMNNSTEKEPVMKDKADVEEGCVGENETGVDFEVMSEGKVSEKDNTAVEEENVKESGMDIEVAKDGAAVEKENVGEGVNFEIAAEGKTAAKECTTVEEGESIGKDKTGLDFEVVSEGKAAEIEDSAMEDEAVNEREGSMDIEVAAKEVVIQEPLVDKKAMGEEDAISEKESGVDIEVAAKEEPDVEMEG